MRPISKHCWLVSCWTFLIISVISICIGIPCIVYGCNSSYTQCLKYEFQDKAVVKISTTQNEGQQCISWITLNKVMQCTGYLPYIYYTANVHFDTCIYQDDTAYDTNQGALAYGQAKYPSGLVLEMAVTQDNPSVCERPGGLVKNLAIIGFVFSPIACISTLLFIITFLCFTNTKEQENLNRFREERIRNRPVQELSVYNSRAHTARQEQPRQMNDVQLPVQIAIDG